MPKFLYEFTINADSPEKAQEIVEATKKTVNEQFSGLPDLSALFGPLKTPEGQQVRTGGCWLAHYPDWSGFAVFGAELDALRYAVEHSMQVAFAEWGEVR